MKSNTSAMTMSITIVAVKPVKSIGLAASAVLEHDAFDDERDVLALVGGQLDELVDGLQLDELPHVLLLAEQARDRGAHDAVGVGLQGVDLLADLENGGAIVHR